MDVLGYTVLQEESLPGFLKGRPQVAMFLACAGALLLVTALSITIGIFIGYTYCYLEHRSGVIKANITRTNVKIIPLSVFGDEDNKTSTINNALMNNYIISKLMRVSGIKEEPSFGWTEVTKVPETTA